MLLSFFRPHNWKTVIYIYIYHNFFKVIITALIASTCLHEKSVIRNPKKIRKRRSEHGKNALFLRFLILSNMR
jgi:hypothetical protein